MGTKRVGLARTQALIQGLKRELLMGGAELSNAMLSNSKGVEMCVFSAPALFAGNSVITSGGLVIPANHVLTGAGAVCTTEITVDGSSKLGVSFGTTDSLPVEEIALADEGLRGNDTAPLAVGKGVSTHSHETVALGGITALVFVGNKGYSAAAKTIYGQLKSTTSNITAGAMVFWMTYRLVS